MDQGVRGESVADDRQARPRGANDAIRVLIVDDHALFRRGLEMVLEQEDDVEVVGEAGDGAEAIDGEIRDWPWATERIALATSSIEISLRR